MPGFRPHVAVFNNCQDEARISFCRRLKKQGTRIVVMPTEGIPTLKWQLDDWAGKSSDWSMLDKYLAWNDVVANKIIEGGSLRKEQVVTLGIPRFDFYRKPLSDSAMEKDEYCKMFSLDQLAMHFGHCEKFALIDVDMDSKKILSENSDTPPPHEPGVLPRWLAEKGANIIIAGGMGQRAQDMFISNGIKVVIGASAIEPRAIVEQYLSDSLETGDNVCDH